MIFLKKNQNMVPKRNSVNNNGKNEHLLQQTFFCKPIFKTYVENSH